MITKRSVLALGVIVIVGDLFFRLVTTRDQAVPAVSRQEVQPRSALNRSGEHLHPVAEPGSADLKRASMERTPPSSRTEPAQKNAQTNSKPAMVMAPASQTSQAAPEVYYAQTRLALSLVGTDPDAEEFWITAINDPNLSAKQREDLIEDLNEEGFEDPKNPTEDELPLIVNRLLLIEELAPNAMDQVNASSFAEAYKDLLEMYVRLTRQ